RDRMQYVGGRNKENFRQVVFDVQVMILEHVVLFRIQNFQQGRARVAAKVCSQLIDFVEQQHWINRAGLLHHLNDLSGQSSDIGAPVTANFSFVTNAAQRK